MKRREISAMLPKRDRGFRYFPSHFPRLVRRLPGVLVSGTLLATSLLPTIPSAGAVSLFDILIASGLAGTSTVSNAMNSESVTYAPPVQDEQTVGFYGLEKRVRANNQTVKSLELSAASVKGTNIKHQFDVQRESYDIQAYQYMGQANQYKAAMDRLKKEMDAYPEESQGDAAYQAMEAQYHAIQVNYNMAAGSAQAMAGMSAALDSSEDDAKEDLNDTYYSTMKQIDNTINMMVVGAQDAYIGLITMQESLETLDRNLAKIDRNIAVIQKQIEIGAASQLTLDNLQQTRRSLESSRETLLTQQRSTENSLALLLGSTADMTVKVSEMPSVTEAQLSAIKYGADLIEAQKNSYSIWSKQDAIRTASNQYEDDLVSTLDAFNAAREDLEAEKENVANKFRQLYNDVQEKQRLIVEAQADYETQKKNFAVTEVQYQRGMISRNAYLDEQDALAEKEDAVTTAQHNLFSAYNTYDWAKRGYMS